MTADDPHKSDARILSSVELERRVASHNSLRLLSRKTNPSSWYFILRGMHIKQVISLSEVPISEILVSILPSIPIYERQKPLKTIARMYQESLCITKLSIVKNSRSAETPIQFQFNFKRV